MTEMLLEKVVDGGEFIIEFNKVKTGK